ncbi:hypothetical protein BN9982_450012 [Mycobacterium tuberculosis]|nr:hypothetical protein BN9982_450012 [Mycobacterium tuberculosis]
MVHKQRELGHSYDVGNRIVLAGWSV